VQAKPGWITPAVDVYALGAILYELLVARPPFVGESALDTFRMVVTEDVVPPRRVEPKVPKDLETICLKCLQKDPNKRYLTAAALADDLSQYLDGRPIAAKPMGPVERANKWLRLHPLLAVGVTVGMVVVLTLAVIGAGTIAKWW
jgi:eukaryotic-like serine/threonine-protein kinase